MITLYHQWWQLNKQGKHKSQKGHTASQHEKQHSTVRKPRLPRKPEASKSHSASQGNTSQIVHHMRQSKSQQTLQKVPQPSKPTWVSVHDVVLNSLRPSTQPSQLLPELSHFYQTHKHRKMSSSCRYGSCWCVTP